MHNQGNRSQPAMTQQQQVSYKAQLAAQRRAMDNRRNFLWGLLAGGLGMLGLTLAGKALHIGPFGGDDTSTSQLPGSTGLQSTPATGSGTSTGTSTVIAQESAVPANSAVT